MFFTALADLWLQNPLGQTLGLIASGLYFLSALQRSDKRLQGIMLLGAIVWVLHYSLLQAWVAALTYTVGIARNGLIYLDRVESLGRIRTTIFFTLAYIVCGLLTVNQPIEVIPCICSTLYAIALFNLTNIQMRVVMMSSQILFFIYAIYIGSIGGALGSFTEFMLTVFTVFQLLKLNRRVAADS